MSEKRTERRLISHFLWQVFVVGLFVLFSYPKAASEYEHADG